MNNLTRRRCIAVLLTLMVLATPVLSQAVSVTKNEVVYITLQRNGDVGSVYVVNRFDADAVTDIVDYGEYYSVANLTDLSDLLLSADTVRFTMKPDTFYYQGTPASNTLPWIFTVGYRLNGESMPASSLAGKTGKLEIAIEVRDGPERYEDFYKYFLLNMTVTLDGEKCRNLTAEGATVASNGSKRVLTYMILPGSEVSYTITTDVTDFTMDDITINGVPMSIDIGDLDISELTDKLTDLTDGISALSSGAGQLSGGAGSLAEGTSQLVDGANAYAAGLAELQSSVGEAMSKIRSVTDKLSTVSSIIEKGADLDTTDLQKTVDDMISHLSDVEKALRKASEATKTIRDAASGLEDEASAIQNLASSLYLSESDIAVLRGLLGAASGNADASAYLGNEIGALSRLLNQANNVNGAISELLDASSGMGERAKKIADATGDLADAILPSVEAAESGLKALQEIMKNIDTSSGTIQVNLLAPAMEVANTLVGKLDALTGGVDQLVNGFASLQAGINSVNDGAQQLAGGARAVGGGAWELKDATDGMDEKITDKVDEALASFTGEGYEPVSFMDERNIVQAVQFVIRIPGISEETVQTVTDDTPEEEKTIWEKIGDLFK